MQRKVRVGLISTSWFAEWNLIPNTQSHPDAKLVSICGRQLDRAKDVAKKYGIEKVYTDYKELIRSDDLDAVIEKLNSTYQADVKDEVNAEAYFLN